MEEQIRLAFGEEVPAASGAVYQNLQQLGQGGNATTFLMVARTGPHAGVPFAVKVFRRLSMPDRRAAFEREAIFLQSCQHPAVMRHFDGGVLRGDHPFFVAEYLSETLGAAIRSGRLTTVAKLTATCQLVSALRYLVGLTPQVIHRDIKPGNVFLKGQSCVLGDFGLVKFLDDESADREQLATSQQPGMPWRYRTPDLVEYLRGRVPPTPASDVFQLGLVIAELFSGRNPQRPTDSFLDPVELDEPRSIYIPGSLHEPIRNLIVSMLDPSPTSRPTADELLTAWLGLQMQAARMARALDGRVL